MRALSLALSALLLLAGCVSKDEPVATAAAEEPPAEDAPVEAPPPPPTPPSSSESRPAPSGPPSSNASSSPPPPPAAPPAPAPPRVETLTWEGNLSGVGFGSAQSLPAHLCCFGVVPAGENTAGAFDVGGTLQGIVVELVWEDAAFDLDLELNAPDAQTHVPPAVKGTTPALRSGHWWFADAGTPGAPDGHAALRIVDAAPLALSGTWTWSVLPKGPAHGVAFTVLVTLFYDAPPAEGFTAVGA